MMQPINPNIAVCLPTRGRRHLLQRFLDSFYTTYSGHSIILMRNGEDDPDLKLYDDVKLCGQPISRTIGPDLGFAPACQDLYARYPYFKYYLTMEDDAILLDQGWDARLIELFEQSFPHGLGLIQLRDISQEIRCEMVSKKWIDTVGYFMQPHLREHAVVGLYTLAEALGLSVWGEQARIQHIGEWRGGYSNGKTEWMSPDARERYKENDLRFAKWMSDADGFNTDVLKLEMELHRWQACQ